MATNPIQKFAKWLDEAEATGMENPNAMILSTADKRGRPSSRAMLLKGCDDRGFVFYTNLESRKGRELADNPWVALNFHWREFARQVRVEGKIDPVSPDEADAYFASRARTSRLGAWASKQSQPLDNRARLLARVARYEAEYPLEVPRPPYWSGFRVVPETIELWEESRFRLHKRELFSRKDQAWESTLLYP